MSISSSSMIWIVLTGILLARATTASSCDCPRGSFRLPGTCECDLCPPGTYQHFANATYCIQCEPGQYLPFSGSHSEGACRSCPAGTFSNAGSASCTPCPNGTSSTERSSECVLCSRGTFIASQWPWFEPDMEHCKPCRAGYADEENLLECKVCPDGSAAPPGSTSIEQCSPCPAGTDTNGLNPCGPCQPGSFSTTTSLQCTLCQAGYRAERDFGSTSCIPCEPGQYGRNPEGHGDTRQCFDCPANTTSYAHGARFCRRINGPCPRGFIQTSAGDCERCNTDERYDVEQERCVPCSRTQGSVGGLPLLCAPCADVIKAGVENTHCLEFGYMDLRDTVSVDGSCAPGTHIHDTEFVRFCRRCNPGYFSSESNSAECLPCSSGTVSTDYGATSCEACPERMVPNDIPAQCVVRETNCAVGTRLLLSGNSSYCERNECSISEDGSFSCLPCTGSYYDTFSFEGCDPCPGNEVRNLDFSCGCRGPLAVNLGMVNGVCSQCPAGSYGRLVEGGDANECVQCAAGTYREVVADEQLLQSLCPRCSVPSPCKKCPVGFVSTQAGATECEKCPSGTFSYGIGDIECLPFGGRTAAVTFNDPLDMSVERDVVRSAPSWDERQ